VNLWINDYIKQQKAALESIPVDKVHALIKRLRDALEKDQQIFVCGNGGSASNASHFATDLGKGSSDKLGKRFRILSLNDNCSWMTALGNDYTYEDIYVRQLMNYARAGDILFILSVSGSSPNIVKAVDWANDKGLHTIALVGGKKGKVEKIAKESIVISSEHYGRVEDAQMAICHMLCYAFMENA
jgi:D-sedoheptulose 7-phosphate isomerase